MKSLDTKVAEIKSEITNSTDRDLVLIKTALILFTAVLNICCIQLFLF